VSSAYSLSCKEGWRRFVDTPARTRPEVLTVAGLKALGPDARDDYAAARADWHANFGTIATPQLTEIRDELELIVASNRQDPDRDTVPGAPDAADVQEGAGLGVVFAAQRVDG
jgi:hypothetical protein